MFIDGICWDRISPGCVSGTDIKKHVGKSLGQCKTLCVQHPGCVSIDSYNYHGGINPEYNPGDCLIQTGVNASGCDGHKHNLDLYVKKLCPPGKGSSTNYPIYPPRQHKK